MKKPATGFNDFANFAGWIRENSRPPFPGAGLAAAAPLEVAGHACKARLCLAPQSRGIEVPLGVGIGVGIGIGIDRVLASFSGDIG